MTGDLRIRLTNVERASKNIEVGSLLQDTSTNPGVTYAVVEFVPWPENPEADGCIAVARRVW